MFSHFITLFFFFNDTATTEIYTLSLHDALPILCGIETTAVELERGVRILRHGFGRDTARSEEHTSELQSQSKLVCRLLLEKKKYRDCGTLTHHNVPCVIYVAHISRVSKALALIV